VKGKGGGSISFKPGQIIITEGAPGKEMFIVEEGKVEIFRQIGSEEKRVNLLEIGDFFGEMSIIDDLPRGASARALTECQLLAVDHTTFDQMLRRYPDVAIRMLRKMSARMRELQAALEERDAEQGPKVRKGAPVTAGQPAAVATAGQPAALPKSPKPEARKPAAVRPEAPAPAPPQPAGIVTEGEPTALVTDGEPAAPASGGTPGALRLVLFDTGAVFELPDIPSISVGRFDTVSGVSPEIDLTEADTYKTTSRRHAKLLRESGRLFVREEIGTANGTFVNGKKLDSGAEVELNVGDWIQFGGVKTILKAG
jgi:Cyclic nucleotide-binding domain/FHA domain